MASINMTMKHDLTNTPLPNAFIDDYMLMANPAYSVIFIYAFRQCYYGNFKLSNSEIAMQLNILESDVINAWKYWEDAGLIKIISDDDDNNLKLEFLYIHQKKILTKKEPVEVNLKEVNLKETIQQETVKQEVIHQELLGSNVVLFPEKPSVVLETRPQYALEELEIYKKNSKDIEALFNLAEQVMGKLLSYNDLNILFSFYDWLRLPNDVLERLLNYCGENGHNNIRYIEKVAIDWAENKINTVEKADEYINTFNKDYREILKAFGHSNRNPTKSEIKYMQKWLTEYALKIDIILEACDKTIMQIGQPKFSYTDKILKKWKDNNVCSLEDIIALEESFYQETVNTPPAGKTSSKKAKAQSKNRFINFEQRDIDYDKMEKMEREYIEQSLKG